MMKTKKNTCRMRTWEQYLNHIKNIHPDEVRPLTTGDDSGYETMEETAMFTKLDSYDKLLRQYGLAQVAGSGDDFERALNVMNWLSKNTFYSGMPMKILPDNSLKILKSSFQKPFSRAINCRYKAIVLSDCLLALGMKAYPVCMQAEKKADCHFVSHVYINELNKWCILDPSFNNYFTYENGAPMSVFELKSLMINGHQPDLNGYSFNGTEECTDVYLSLFIGYCLTNVSTWADNTAKGRKLKLGKAFKTRIPAEHT